MRYVERCIKDSKAWSVSWVVCLRVIAHGVLLQNVGHVKLKQKFGKDADAS